MPLVSMGDLLKKAQAGGYAVGAFNIENMEMAQAVISAGESLGAPVILQTTSSTVKYASLEIFAAVVAAAAKKAHVPVVMHLDHGSSPELCMAAVEAGYTSVMYDGSKLSFDQNVENTSRVAAFAHERGIPVEAELGTVGGKEDEHNVSDKDAQYTNAEQADEFARLTGIDSLAIAIGTSHGHYKGVPMLDFERLAQIRAKVAMPLVLHGTSGVPEDSVRKCVSMGMTKVNFATELRDAYTGAVRKSLAEDTDAFDPKYYGTAGRQAVFDLVCSRIILLGSSGKARQ